jgi:hypothetical protein
MEMEVEISYLDLFVFTNHAISPNELRNDLYQYKIKIKDKEDILDFIYRCRKIELLPAENVGGPINVRCCIDFYFYGMKKFSYSLGAFGTHIIIGNTLFENDDVFYDFVYEYLPRKEMKYINDLLELKKSGKLP